MADNFRPPPALTFSAMVHVKVGDFDVVLLDCRRDRFAAVWLALLFAHNLSQIISRIVEDSPVSAFEHIPTTFGHLRTR